MRQIVLEETTNTHTVTGNEVVENFRENEIVGFTTKEAKVTHGEHRDINLPAGNYIKYVQQELNPVTRKMQQAYD